MSPLDEDIKKVLTFWFEESEPKDWFKKDIGFDTDIRKKFNTLIEKALNNKLDMWTTSLEGCLAIIILLDQFPRNIFREDRKAFSGDEKALKISSKCVLENYLPLSPTEWCHFILIPMMHSENLIIQNQSLPLFQKYTSNKTYDFALRHQKIIEKFGRFPHRNKILGRKSTEEELTFLKMPRSSF